MPPPSIIQEIEKAIGAHRQWKYQLRLDIAANEVMLSVETARYDADCEFGQWLESLDPGCESEEFRRYYQRVVSLHGDFHRSASDIVALIGRGALAAAGKKLSGDFRLRSAKLLTAMWEWRLAILEAA